MSTAEMAQNAIPFRPKPRTRQNMSSQSFSWQSGSWPISTDLSGAFDGGLRLAVARREPFDALVGLDVDEQRAAPAAAVPDRGVLDAWQVRDVKLGRSDVGDPHESSHRSVSGAEP